MARLSCASKHLMRPNSIAIIAGCMLFGLSACASSTRKPIAQPAVGDGSVGVEFDQNLPPTLPVSRLLVVIDGAVLYQKKGPLTTRHLDVFRGKIPGGEHTAQVVVDVDVPCGVANSPHGKVTVRSARSFSVRKGSSGGVIRINAFAAQPWRNPQESVRLTTTLDSGLDDSADQWISSYARQKLVAAKLACSSTSDSNESERAQCVVMNLVEGARAERDVVALLCYNDKLTQVNAALRLLKESGDSIDPTLRSALESKIAHLVADTENCVGEDAAAQCYIPAE